MLPASTLIEAEALLAACRAKGILLATAESCTGGLIAAALTAIAGSSDVVDRGFVTYSNDAKNRMIGVPMPMIERYGAVSEQVAEAMATGALSRSRATIAVSVTGVAGPAAAARRNPSGWSASAWPAPAAPPSPTATSSPATGPRSAPPPSRMPSR